MDMVFYNNSDGTMVVRPVFLLKYNINSTTSQVQCIRNILNSNFYHFLDVNTEAGTNVK